MLSNNFIMYIASPGEILRRENQHSMLLHSGCPSLVLTQGDFHSGAFRIWAFTLQAFNENTKLLLFKSKKGAHLKIQAFSWLKSHIAFK